MNSKQIDSSSCVLCQEAGGELIWQGKQCRVIRAKEDGYPAFYRVIWTAHVAELSELKHAERALCMEVVVAVEKVLREQLAPTKINLAALGNMVPHLHWHVIARFDWDRHFPAAVWAPTQRERDAAKEADIVARIPVVDALMRERLQVQFA